MTHRTVYRKTDITVTLRADGTFRSAYVGRETDVSDLLTDEQKAELSAQVRREIEEEI